MLTQNWSCILPDHYSHNMIAKFYIYYGGVFKHTISPSQLICLNKLTMKIYSLQVLVLTHLLKCNFILKCLMPIKRSYWMTNNVYCYHLFWIRPQNHRLYILYNIVIQCCFYFYIAAMYHYIVSQSYKQNQFKCPSRS